MFLHKSQVLSKELIKFVKIKIVLILVELPVRYGHAQNWPHHLVNTDIVKLLRTPSYSTPTNSLIPTLYTPLPHHPLVALTIHPAIISPFFPPPFPCALHVSTLLNTPLFSKYITIPHLSHLLLSSSYILLPTHPNIPLLPTSLPILRPLMTTTCLPSVLSPISPSHYLAILPLPLPTKSLPSYHPLPGLTFHPHSLKLARLAYFCLCKNVYNLTSLSPSPPPHEDLVEVHVSVSTLPSSAY